MTAAYWILVILLVLGTFLSAAYPLRRVSSAWRGVAALFILEILFQVCKQLIYRMYSFYDSEAALLFLQEYDAFCMVLWLLCWCLSVFMCLLFVCPLLREEKREYQRWELFIKVFISLAAAGVIACLLLQVASTACISYAKGAAGVLSAVIVLAGALFMYFFAERYYTLKESRDEYEKMEQYRMEQLEFYQDKMISEERIRQLYHDMNKYYDAFLALKEEAPDEVSGYVSELTRSLKETYRPYDSGNTLVDTILMEKEKAAGKEGIPFEVRIQTKRLKDYKSVYLCSIFANALDNAIEACQRQQEKGYIRVEITKMGGGVFILFENPCQTEPSVYGNFPTWKADSFLHGLGLKNIRNAAEKCGGTVSVHIGDGVFSLSVLL